MKNFFYLFLFFLISCDVGQELQSGYIEGEYVYVAPVTTGILEEIFVKRGDGVKIGDKLFALDTKNLRADVDLAELNLDRAQSNYANLSKGMRKEEILVIMKQHEQAKAVLINAEKEYQRYKKLSEQNYASKADLDEKTSLFNQAKARVEELDATLKTAMLGARDDELKMALAEIDIAKQNLIKAERNYADSNPVSKVNGIVEDVFFRVGETVISGTPVIKILPPENVMVRFFVSQEIMPKLQINQTVYVSCDGCSEEIEAEITFISNQAEFTPPVIYSVESREKLVFMVEAKFVNISKKLRPGLPVSIRLEK